MDRYISLLIFILVFLIFTDKLNIFGVNKNIQTNVPQTKEHFNFKTHERNMNNVKYDDIFYKQQLEDLYDKEFSKYDSDLYNQDRNISEIYDELVEPKYARNFMPKVYDGKIKIDGIKKPAYNNQHSLELNNWSYYDNENFINGGADKIDGSDGLYAFDPYTPNFAVM